MSGAAPDPVTAAIEASRLVPVIVLDDAAAARPLGHALKAGGLRVAEVTFRTAAAPAAIAELAGDPDLVVGAGTVTRTEQVDQALAAGARFIVTPGLSPAVVRACQDRAVPVFPGIVTPTEIQLALDAGLDTVKFFPAETFGGVAALKAMSAPYSMVRFIPTGGVSPANLQGYLDLACVLAVGGSWMVAKDLLARRDFATITELTADAVAIASGRA